MTVVSTHCPSPHSGFISVPGYLPPRLFWFSLDRTSEVLAVRDGYCTKDGSNGVPRIRVTHSPGGMVQPSLAHPRSTLCLLTLGLLGFPGGARSPSHVGWSFPRSEETWGFLGTSGGRDRKRDSREAPARALPLSRTTRLERQS